MYLLHTLSLLLTFSHLENCRKNCAFFYGAIIILQQTPHLSFISFLKKKEKQKKEKKKKVQFFYNLVGVKIRKKNK